MSVKGHVSPEYKVQTQYNHSVWMGRIVNGRADLMVRMCSLESDGQSAYHEFFLAIQVEEGQPFMLDQLNLYGNFDTGWWNPLHKELGVSLQGLIISQPYYEPAMDEPSDEPVEPAVEPSDEWVWQDTAEPEDTAEELSIDPNEDDQQATLIPEPAKGCASASILFPWLWLVPAFLIWRDSRKK